MTTTNAPGGRTAPHRDGDGVAPSADPRLARLHAAIERLPGAVVALSGGVDSTLVAAVAARALGARAVAVTAASPSLAPAEREEARALAAAIGIAHHEVETRELERPGYVENSPERCFHCKDELYGLLAAITAGEGAIPASAAWRDWAVLDGTNADDVGDHRPGRRAATLHGVRSPLQEAALDKADVRALAQLLGLPNWDKPAAACLASRLPYGTSVTVERLRQVAQAEEALRTLGFRELRVRHHGDVARIEVPPAAFPRLVDDTARGRVVDALRAAGFTYVAVDLAGFRSGSMNEVLTLTPVARG